MKRRTLINYAAVGAASATVTACTNVSGPAVQGGALPTVRWNMATSWPISLDTIFGGAKTICDRLKEMTGGRFTITPFPAGELVPPLQVFDAVQGGNVEVGHTASYYYVGKNPALGFATSMPFGFTAQQQNAWLYQGGGLDAIQKIYADFGVINFPAGNTGTQMGGWFKREIKTVADLKGLKMRIPGIGGEVMNRLGVNVQVLPGGEIYLALERGAIDAAEWIGPYDDEKLGLHKATQFYYYPGWWEPGPTLDVLVNRAQWERLPKEYQEAFKTATYEANATMLAQYEARNGEALKRLVAGGTKLTAYSKEILQTAQKTAFELYEEKAAQNPSFKAIYEPWKAFREQIYQWDKLNELSFNNFATS
ncbi:MAG TPA: TRAP transporter substrate-binding protein [Oscillatoriales cyanobacterium M59_W2019_021]|nr:TRAP transporter substrate-binding protein [Oscillatoriales cyanobacterium M4454_W2019_049]HIK53138.1 TRAP transporter substrate-binding protein [Oscillatoriales cyanobacterium M59_W2019_021]